MPNHQFRLLLSAPRCFPYLGGVENHVYQVSRRLASQGVSVTVVSADPEQKLPPCEEIEGVTMRRVPVLPAKSDWYYSPEFYRMARHGDERGPFDLVHVHNYLTFASPLAMMGARDGHVPYVLTFHGGGHPSRLRNAVRDTQRRALRPLLAQSRRLVRSSRFELQLFGDKLNIPHSKFTYIPNGCDIVHGDLPAETDPNLIISLGRLERFKGHQLAIAAMPDILKVRPNARLRVLGHGPYEGELNALAEKLGVANHVEIRGVPLGERNEMAMILAKAALVVSFSEFETHPIAVMEALALKRSVLVTKTSGLGELAEDGFARAIELNSTPQQAAEAMLQQLAAPIAPPNVHLPTWDECAGALLSLYTDVLSHA